MCVAIIESDFPSDAFFLALSLPIAYALYSANSCMLPLILSKILESISDDRTPFTIKNANRLLWLALIMLLYDLLGELLNIVDTQFLLQIGDSSIMVGTFVRDYSSNAGTTIDIFPLVIAAVFFALSYVFKYGVLLQQESDETL